MSELLRKLAAESGLNDTDVRMLVATAPRRYKQYEIDKRNGGKREIAQPARELKILQRILVDNVLNLLPISSAATAYRAGVSIRANAEYHAAGNSILKFDFKDFFPSIVSSDWENYCKDNHIFDNQLDIEISSNILFFKKNKNTVLRLAIGAPSSPILSNILMRSIDEKILRAVSEDKVVYTRYADDMTFSAARAFNLVNVERLLRTIISETNYPRLRINEEKTVFATSKYRRFVTGLVITNDGQVSLGRDRKRRISAGIDHFRKSKLNSEETAKLAGMLAFVHAVEPNFLDRLIARYGIETIKRIKRGLPPVRRSSAMSPR